MKQYTYLFFVFTLLAAPTLATDTPNNPVEIANLVGALTWCKDREASKQKEILDKLEASQEKLNMMIQENIISREESLLIRERVAEYGYFLGRQLNPEICKNLPQNYDIYLEDLPWELITSS